MRHRPGFEWLIAALAAVAIAVGVILILMNASPARGADLTLRPGELSLLTRVVYHEARSDGVQGMAAVAHVALNRWEDGRFGKTLAAVLTAPGQFAVGPARDERDIAWVLAVHAASGAVLGRLTDNTGSATYFYKSDMARPPRWAHEFTKTAKVGAHVFLRPVVDYATKRSLAR